MDPAPRLLAAALAASVAAGGLLAGLPAGTAAASTAQVTSRAQAAHRASTAQITRRTQAARPADVVAAAAELVNMRTGRWMWSRGLDAEHPIASITKVMTALVVLQAGDLNRTITVTEAAEQYGRAYSPGSAGLHPGDVLTARQLLEAMLLPSGSDAAYLLATAYGPGWRAFVRKMNATARKLGMTRTHFANFDGLPWPTEHATYSTPRDLIVLSKAAMKLPVFRQIVAQRTHWIAATSRHHHYFWTNTDLLIGTYRGAIGIKTGFTQGAGYCLLFAARRGPLELMGVVLDSTDTEASLRFTAAADLLNWGFDVAGAR
jgi:serine-type D-Ala-D-Ala carboxypeptidase (penicillin-binding protein 5/6)